MSAPNSGYDNPDDRTWALIASFGSIIFWWLAPLIALLARGNQSPVVRQHAVAALNYTIPAFVAWFVLMMLGYCAGALIFDFLGLLGTCVWVLGWLANAVICLLAGLKANNGEVPKYPFSIGLVK